MIWSMHSKTLPITLAPELESETNKWDFRRVSFSCTNIVGWCVHIVCKYPWLCAWREHRLHLWKASLEQFDTPSRASQREIDWKQKFGLAAKKNEILFYKIETFLTSTTSTSLEASNKSSWALRMRASTTFIASGQTLAWSTICRNICE